MNTKLTSALSLLLMAILCFSFAIQASAITRTPGVEVDDEFSYSVKGYWTTTNASRTVPAYFAELNNTAWFNVTVSAVMDANVTARTTQHFNNGTDEDNRLITINVATGDMYVMNGFQGFFYGNLGVGDPLRPSGDTAIWINETITRDYGSGKRDTNVVSFSFAVYLSEDLTNSTTGTEKITFYIDKATGALVERIDYIEFPDQAASEHWLLTRTNVWTVTSEPSNLPVPLIIVIVVVVVVVIVAAGIIWYYKGNRRRRKKQRRF